MIKEYFTDGLIGIAILLSLFRMDLIGINNIINYPEVQEIILGQSAAYLPANFHNIHSPLHAFGNPKHLDFDNFAFSSWFQNLDVQIHQRRTPFNIEAFLLSESRQNVEQFQIDETTASISQDISSSLYVEESPYSPNENEVVLPGTSERPDLITSGDTMLPELGAMSGKNKSADENVNTSPDFTAPDEDLTKEDLKLIDILYQQDVDLGVGKEIFDTSFREELEREQELEFIKQQEKQKAQLIAKEREDKKKREQKDKWLKRNFKRDGETGEWVHLWSDDVGETSSRSIPISFVESLGHNVSLGASVGLFGDIQEDLANSGQGGCTNETATLQQGHFVEHQHSFGDGWNGLVDYLNTTANSFGVGHASQHDDEMMLSPLGMMGNLVQEQDVNLQTGYLIHNATLPTSFLDVSTDFNVLTPAEELNSSIPFQSTTINSTMDFDFGDLSFFSNLTSLQSLTPEDVEQMEPVDTFSNIVKEFDCKSVLDDEVSEGVDVNDLITDSRSASSCCHGNTSPFSGLSDRLDVLEGATGGSDYSINYDDDVNDQFSKISRLSESSNDSGFTYQRGFSSPSFSASSSSSSYAGSPGRSHMGMNTSASGNDTENDPHGSCSIYQHHVAHNHTYNTLLGQVPREVKKYATKVLSRKGPQSRDQRRAEELKIPFSIDDIISSSVETFNEMLAAHKLNDTQLTLIRDIRRRGKNKVAAQNCRKRKVSIIFNLADEMTELQDIRDKLIAERVAMDREKRSLKEKFGRLYTHIFQSLRDPNGEPYDPNFYSLQHSTNGSVFLVPRSAPINNNNRSSNTSSSSSSSASSSSKDSVVSKKRKPYGH